MLLGRPRDLQIDANNIDWRDEVSSFSLKVRPWSLSTCEFTGLDWEKDGPEPQDNVENLKAAEWVGDLGFEQSGFGCTLQVAMLVSKNAVETTKNALCGRRLQATLFQL